MDDEEKLEEGTEEIMDPEGEITGFKFSDDEGDYDPDNRYT